MNSNPNTKARILKRKSTKVPAPFTVGEEESGINPFLSFVKLANDPNAYKETVSIKMRINNTVSKEKIRTTRPRV